MARGVPGSAAPLAGRWRIVEMSGWDRDAIDLVEPGFIEFTEDGTGQFGFIAVRGWLDCRPVERDGQPGVEFTWKGVDEGDQVSGRGWASLVDDAMVEVTCSSTWETTRASGQNLLPLPIERTGSERVPVLRISGDRPATGR
jgi:hypothetical protein